MALIRDEHSANPNASQFVATPESKSRASHAKAGKSPAMFQILDNTLTTTGNFGVNGGTTYFGEVGDADLFVGNITIEFDYEPLACVDLLPEDCLQQCPQVPGPICAGRRWALVFYGAAGTPRPFGLGLGYNLIWSDRGVDRGLSLRFRDNTL